VKVKQVTGSILVVASAIFAAIGAFAPAKLGAADLGFTLFAIHRLWPELLAALLLGAWLYASEGNVSGLLRGSFQWFDDQLRRVRSARPRDPRALAGALGFVVLMGATAWGAYEYCMYRSRYLLGGHLQRDFKTQRLLEAGQHEAKFEFLKAADLYQGLRREFASDMDSAHWLDRETLNRQIAQYAAHSVRHAKGVEGRLGLSRPSVLAYAEVVRVNPNDPVALERLAILLEAFHEKMPAMRAALSACLKDPATADADAWRSIEPLLFESEVIEAARRRGDPRYSRTLCKALAELGSEDEAWRFVLNSWQTTSAQSLVQQAKEGAVAIVKSAPAIGTDVRK
jgi:hypothetical protein